MALSFLKSKIASRQSDSYSYDSLNENAKEIRILTLLPGAFDSIIRLQLNTEILDPTSNERPSYEALSYAWGSIKNHREIFIEDNKNSQELRSLRVTQNLAAALLHLRHEHEPRRLWIDAICVNQRDLNERSSQVQRMTDVYRLSSRVVVWLGVEENDSSMAIALLEKLASMIELDLSTFHIKPSALAVGEPEWADRQTLPPWDLHEWEAIRHFIFRPWFERIWVQQEIRLGDRSQSVIQCGLKQIRWKIFYDSIGCLLAKPHYGDRLSGDIYPAYSYRRRLVLICDLGDPNSGHNFCYLLYSTKDCKCTDPRDRIYSLLGLSPYFHPKPIPDYKKSVSEVYQEIVLKYEASFRNLDILTNFELLEKGWISVCERKIADLSKSSRILQKQNSLFLVPSWAQIKSPATIPRLLSHSWAGTMSKSYVRSDNKGVLKVAGVHLQETVHDKRQIPAPLTRLEFEKILAQLYEFVKESDAHHGQRTTLDMFCRTIGGNGYSDEYRPFTPELPNFQKTKLVIAYVVGLTEDYPDASSAYESLENALSIFAEDRSFFTTKSGKIGLAPRSAKPGDQVVAFLGCRSPMLLRPVSGGQFQLVGEVYFHDACSSQAFLGPMPEGYKSMYDMDYDQAGNSTGYHTAVVNINTMERVSEDPRLGPLPPGWTSRMTSASNRIFRKPDALVEEGGYAETYEDPRLTFEGLEKRGVVFTHFELV